MPKVKQGKVGLSYSVLEIAVHTQLVPRQCGEAEGHPFMETVGDKNKRAKGGKLASFAPLYCMPSSHSWASAILTLPIPGLDKKPITNFKFSYFHGCMRSVEGHLNTNHSVPVVLSFIVCIFVLSLYFTGRKMSKTTHYTKIKLLRYIHSYKLSPKTYNNIISK